MPISKVSDFKAAWHSEIIHHERAVVFFFATWSPPDKMLGQLLEKIIPDFEDKLKFFSVDIDEINWENEPDIQALLGMLRLYTTPLLSLVKHGEVITDSIGYRSETDLREMLSTWADQ